MQSHKTTFRLLVATITIACAGLMWLQVRFLLNTADLKRASFDEAVMSSLARSAASFDDLEAMNRVFFVGSPGREVPGTMEKVFQVKSDSVLHMSVLTSDKGSIITKVANGQFSYSVDKPQVVTIEAYDVLGRLDTTFIRGKTLVGTHSLPIPYDRMGDGLYFIRLRSGDAVSTFKVDPKGRATGFSVLTSDTVQRERMVRRVLQSLTMDDRPRITVNISPTWLDTVVAKNLREQAVTAPFSAAIVRGDSLVVHHADADKEALLASPYRIPVARISPFSEPEALVVSVPSVTSIILGQMTVEIGLSLFLIGIIVSCFGYSIRTLVRQQEFSHRLNEFINNMTHEFKTPVSTVSLASEALERNEVIRSAAKVRRYNAVIRDENKRMRSQIDRILQMASLEEGEIEFRRETLSMHHVIQSVVSAIEVQISSRSGMLDIALSAKRDAVLGDRVHLENVIHNVLENAVKYSAEKPFIAVRSGSDGDSFELTVSDKGIGIDPAYVGKVFDKYFRVPTGNLHDVKGFGLGLSYVKLVVERHGGSVGLTSEPTRGTTVTVRLPLSFQP